MRTIRIVASAVALLILGPGLGVAQTGHDLFQQALVKERADGDLRGAIEIYERIAQEFAADRTLAAKALVQLGQCYEKLGSTEAERAYRRVVQEYADQDDLVVKDSGEQPQEERKNVAEVDSRQEEELPSRSSSGVMRNTSSRQ